jgi:subtilisin family serine protease
MKQVFAIFATIVFTANQVLAVPVMLPTLLQRFAPNERLIVQRNAPLLSLSFSPEGKLLHARRNATTGKFTVETLEGEQAERITTFLSRLSPESPDVDMALALRSYLAPRTKPEDLEKSPFLTKDTKGRFILTALGKSVLMDVLTAQDGQLLEAMPKPRTRNPVLTARHSRDGRPSVGGLQSVTTGRRAGEEPDAAFDGRVQLGGFDWNSLDTAVTEAGGLQSAGAKRQLNGYAYNEENGTVRVLVAGPQTAGDNHHVGNSAEDQEAVIAAAGLDIDLFREHGATVVRTVSIGEKGLTTIDVPAPLAARLGLALQQRGIESRPARRFRSSSSQAVHALRGATGALLGGQFLPLPQEGVSFGPKLARANLNVDTAGLHNEGMTGRGTTVGIIDSGIYEDHADFKDADGNSRIVRYVDFTGEGKQDVIGHGTHVAGITGGTGKASDGQHTGTAPGTRFVIAKVFGSQGETDESVILAAMKWMGQGNGVDVLNLSLGGPGVANRDPLSMMANHMTVKDNVVVVAAAGNEGPLAGSIGSPGNARYALTVGGVDKKGEMVYFSSRGPVRDANGNLLYAKPDLVAVAGGVDFSAIEQQLIVAEGDENVTGADASGRLASVGGKPVGTCVYSPGIISARSPDDPDTACTLEGNDQYRFMSGTSQATPMTAGFVADVIGYVRGATGESPNAMQVKAVLMETARDLDVAKESQGAGLINGTRVAQSVVDRVKRGIPIGNIAYSLAMRMTTGDRQKLDEQSRYEMTPLGILDRDTGHLIRDEREMQHLLDELRSRKMPLLVKREEGAPVAA